MEYQIDKENFVCSICNEESHQNGYYRIGDYLTLKLKNKIAYCNNKLTGLLRCEKCRKKRINLIESCNGISIAQLHLDSCIIVIKSNVNNQIADINIEKIIDSNCRPITITEEWIHEVYTYLQQILTDCKINVSKNSLL